MRIWAGLILMGLLATSAYAAPPTLETLPQVPAGYIKIAQSIHGRYSNAGALNSVLAGKASLDDDLPISFQWPGIYIEAEFGGPEILINFDNTTDAFTVFIDGEESAKVIKPGDKVYRLGGLPQGWHRLRIEKNDESQDTVGTFGHMWIGPKEDFRWPQPRTRQIEFIGDSYTAGYGNTSPKRECTQDDIWATTDTQQAFGPLTAKHYDADYQINAYSGIGIVRNYDGVAPKRNMPLLYRSALIEDETVHPYNNPQWNPAIVVIALGGNDFSTPVHAGEKWTSEDALTNDYIASYVAFVQQIRASHPDARFILMNYGEARVATAITEVIKRLNAAGETRVAALDVGSGFALTGCDWHLNTADDKRISASLIAYIDAHPELWPNPEKAK
ncbi:SGNH/GDSL hydrolase family protein [Asticcacaulis taihuensis]|uniref:SGNH/GDSL hydrolase family protein n=1 Tax=Asticcacaulis taihuensis TaxID=260084 RepID=UPI0026F0A1FE|nr:SGNH/GDSL hydrolase family protein [Asticcacaulis taihuensis]